MVETASGQLGFLDASRMSSVCSYLPAIKAVISAKVTSKRGGLMSWRVLPRLMRPRLQLRAGHRKPGSEGMGLGPDSSCCLRPEHNISDGLGRATTEALLQEVRKLEGVSAIGMDEVREMLDFEAKRRVLGCEADHECLAEIAGALGVDELLIGTLSEQADGRMIILKRVDQRRAQVRATFDKRLVVGNGEEFLLSVGDAIQNLFAERQNRQAPSVGW